MTTDSKTARVAELKTKINETLIRLARVKRSMERATKETEFTDLQRLFNTLETQLVQDRSALFDALDV